MKKKKEQEQQEQQETTLDEILKELYRYNLDEYLTTDIIIKRLNISIFALRVWIKSGKLPFIRKGRRYLIKWRDAITYYERQTQ